MAAKGTLPTEPHPASKNFNFHFVNAMWPNRMVGLDQGLMVYFWSPTLRRLGQEDYKFELSLSYKAGAFQKMGCLPPSLSLILGTYIVEGEK